MVTQAGLPVRRACQAVRLGRATYNRPLDNWAQRDAAVTEALSMLGATKKPRRGFWNYVDWLGFTGTYIKRIFNLENPCPAASPAG